MRTFQFIRNLIFLSIFFVGIIGCNNKKQTTEIDSKVSLLISQMTLDEKIGQMVQSNSGSYGSDENQLQAIKDGLVGSFLNVESAEAFNKMQRVAVEESRLGIPLIVGRDVIHGYKTIFPIPLGMAATWNPEIVKEAMAIAAKEAASTGVHWTFAPMIDVTWDPRWGRVAESAGEDPYLASQFAIAMVKGFQGDDLSDPNTIAACAKHFVGYGMSEAGRDYNTTYIPEPLLRNVHLRPFKAAVDNGVQTLMSAFNDLNGVPTSGNYFTLKTILRDEWNFDGFVVSDWGSIEEMIAHGYCEDDKAAANKAVVAGVDMEMASKTYITNLKDLIKEGKITEGLINERVTNILRVKYRLGLFEDPYVDESREAKVMLTEDNLQQSRKVARESMVLLKNEGDVLPLAKNKSVALIGPLSNAPREQLGTWVFDGDETNSVTPKEAFEEVLGAKLNFADGLEYSRDKSKNGFAKAIKAAQKSDAIVFIAGEEACLSGEANARGIIDLPGIQTELISELKKTGKPLVLVVLAGRPLAIVDELKIADAVLYAWHPGTMAGPALADLIFGDYSPSGKLPITFVKGAGQIPFYYYRKNTGRPAKPEEIVLIDDIPRNSKQLSLGFKSMHIDYGNTPLLPFGYGLTYTTFEYSKLKSKSEYKMDEEMEFSATITNTGSVEASEIVQLYVRDHFGSLTRPIKELKGFEKIDLKPGESKEVQFVLTKKDLEFYNGSAYVTEPGKFSVWIGPNSDEGVKGEFNLTE